MRRELVTIGAFPWDSRTRAQMSAHPVMWGARRRGMGAVAQPIFFGPLPVSLEQAAANLYHRLLSGGCTTAAMPETSAFQSAYNAAQSGSSLVVDGKYGNDSSAALQYVLTAASGQGGPADGLFSAPPSCFAARVATPAPSTTIVVPPPKTTPVVVTTPAASSGHGLLTAVLAVGAGAAAFVGYRKYAKKRRTSNPCRRLCGARA